VFSGKVLEIKKPENRIGNMEVRFKVERSWKYVNAEEVIVITDVFGGACGYPFKVGESYLVWGYISQKDKTKIGTGLCSGTEILAKAEKILQELGEGKQPRRKSEDRSNVFPSRRSRTSHSTGARIASLSASP
jgi:hypothetical protein